MLTVADTGSASVVLNDTNAVADRKAVELRQDGGIFQIMPRTDTGIRSPGYRMTATDGLPQSQTWYGNDGTDSQQRMELQADGTLELNSYGDGNITGTATKMLAVDVNGKVVEEDLPSAGGVSENTDVSFTELTVADTGAASIFLSDTNAVADRRTVQLEINDGVLRFRPVTDAGAVSDGYAFGQINGLPNYHKWYSSNGTSSVSSMELNVDGDFKLPQYGSGSVTGTAAYSLAVDADGNVIEEALPSAGDIPQNSQTGAYVLAASDAGGHVSITTGGITVNSSVFAIGDAVSIYNDSGSDQTITQGASVSMRSAGTADTGDRTLAQYGLCTLLCVAADTFVISGAGLT